MLEVILFIFVNVFLSDIFLAVDDVDFFSYAEDNIFNCASESTDDVVLSLQDFPQKFPLFKSSFKICVAMF